MAYKKITEEDLQGIGVVGMVDTPQLSTEDMQAKFEETARNVIIPAFNQFVDDVTERDGNVYTKEETDREINRKVVEIGSADMMMAVYDTDANGIVDAAENGVFVYSDEEYTIAGDETVETGYRLTGSGNMGRFKAVRPTGEYTTFNVNGSEYAVKQGSDGYIDIENGCWYTFILDGAVINFSHGGVGREYKVTGGTEEPASPRENTLWVNTQEAVNGWVFSVSEPVEAESGCVWFVTGIQSNISIDVDKKHSVVLNVMEAYQYDGTRWNKKALKCYTGGVWAESDIYVLSGTHGINEGQWTTGKGTMTVDETGVLLEPDNSSYMFAVCDEGVDVTSFNTAVFNVSDFKKNKSDAKSNYVMLTGICDTSDSFTVRAQVTQAGEYALDVSELSGIYYAKLQAHSWYDSDGNLTRMKVNSIKFCR